MGKYIAEQTIKQMIASGSSIKGSKVNVLGLTFKENCADLRNSKVVDIINELQDYGVEVFVHDPQADPAEALHEHGVVLRSWEGLPRADAIVAAVAHSEYREIGIEELRRKIVQNGCFVDVKAGFDTARLKEAGVTVWRL
jgi:UDP-N-acetyl-D-galactosamine dehydrogenase